MMEVLSRQKTKQLECTAICIHMSYNGSSRTSILCVNRILHKKAAQRKAEGHILPCIVLYYKYHLARVSVCLLGRERTWNSNQRPMQLYSPSTVVQITEC